MPGDSGHPCQQLCEAIFDIPPFSLLGNKANLQFIMFGLEGAGKSTFLYKLKIPKWKRDDIIRDMAYMKKREITIPGGRDPAYHYEELSSSSAGMKYGIWDIPGNDVFTRISPIFYRYNRMSAVLFVVDAFSDHWDDVNKITEARYRLNFLLNEDELRPAAFVLILNVGTLSKNQQPAKTEVLKHETFAALERDGHKDASKDMTDQERALYEMLGVPEILKSEAHKERFFAFSCNCADFSTADAATQQKWENCLCKIKDVYGIRGEGSHSGH